MSSNGKRMFNMLRSFRGQKYKYIYREIQHPFVKRQSCFFHYFIAKSHFGASRHFLRPLSANFLLASRFAKCPPQKVRAVHPLHHHPSVRRPAAVRRPRPLPPLPSSLRPQPTPTRNVDSTPSTHQHDPRSTSTPRLSTQASLQLLLLRVLWGSTSED